MAATEGSNNRVVYESDGAAAFYAQQGFLDREEAILASALLSQGMRILDLGCGAGRTTKALYDRGFNNVVGVDYSNNMISVARSRFPDIQFEQGDACDLRFEDSSFDVVLFLYQGIDCIESHDRRRQAYQHIYRVTRPGGVFVHSAHNMLWLNRRIRSTWLPLLRDVIFGRLFRGAYRTFQHSYGEETLLFRTRTSVVRELSEAGFTEVRMEQSRTGSLGLFQPYWHFIARKSD